MQESGEYEANDIAEKRASLDSISNLVFRRICVDDITPEALVDRLEENFLTLLEERGHIAILAELQKSISSIPFSCLCDIDRNDLILLPVQGLNYLQSSYHRNFILDGPAAKQNSNF